MRSLPRGAADTYVSAEQVCASLSSSPRQSLGVVELIFEEVSREHGIIILEMLSNLRAHSHTRPIAIAIPLVTTTRMIDKALSRLAELTLLSHSFFGEVQRSCTPWKYSRRAHRDTRRHARVQRGGELPRGLQQGERNTKNKTNKEEKQRRVP